LAPPLPRGGGARGGRGRDWHRTTERDECFLGVVGGVGLECERRSGLKSVLGPGKREPAGGTLGRWLCAGEARAWSTGDSAGGLSEGLEA
jgi:hypothetical protein